MWPCQAEVLSVFSSRCLIQSDCCRKNTNRHATTLWLYFTCLVVSYYIVQQISLCYRGCLKAEFWTKSLGAFCPLKLETEGCYLPKGHILKEIKQQCNTVFYRNFKTDNHPSECKATISLSPEKRRNYGATDRGHCSQTWSWWIGAFWCAWMYRRLQGVGGNCRRPLRSFVCVCSYIESIIIRSEDILASLHFSSQLYH